MATVYVLKDDLSDLDSGTSTETGRVLSTGAEPAGSVDFSVPALGGEFRVHGFTDADDPGAAGTAGDYTVEVNILQGSSSVDLDVSVARLNSSGGLATSSLASPAQTATAGLHTFTFTGVDLGTWQSGNRLRVRQRYTNSGIVSASMSVETGTTDAETVAPWTTVSGTLNSTAPAAQASAAGAVTARGGLDATSPAAVASATAEATVSGTLAASAPSATASATGTATVTGELVFTASAAVASVSVFVGELAPTPPERTFTVQAEIRTASIPLEGRTATVATDTRTLTVDPENRTLPVDAETRTLVVRR